MAAVGEEEQVLQKIFEELPQKFNEAEKVSVVDAFAQFSQNPTSYSAGYGIEENYPLISKNLMKRYHLRKTAIDNILAFLRESFEKMKRANYDVYFWRKAIAGYVKSEFAEDFLQWFDSLYDNLSKEEKVRLLFLLYGLDYTESDLDLSRWSTPFFDKEEKLSEENTRDSLVEWGLGNFLYYSRSRSGGYTEELKASYWGETLRKRFNSKIPIQERQIEDFFKGLLLDNIKLLEKCSKQSPPIFHNTLGRMTQTAPLIVESSKSYFGISSFALMKIKELIKAEKETLTQKWKAKFSDTLNEFVRQNYPYAQLRTMLDVEGAQCWEIRYAETLEKAPVNITVVVSPYLFSISQSSTILDEVRRTTSSPLNVIFFIRETIPTIADAFAYATKRNFIFLYDEDSQSFYLMERSDKLPEDVSLSVDMFLSRFLPFLERQIQIGKTLPVYLKEYMQNLKYLNKYPRLVSVRNSMLKIEPLLREGTREKLSKKYGDRWKEKVTVKFPEDVKKWEDKIQKRLDKENTKDFLDGTTLGELINIAETFQEVFVLDKDLVKGFLNVLNQHRKILAHPLTEPIEDLDEKTFKTITLSMEYVETVVRST